uniref:FP protein C-terminal domain-containing protein n=1 Tax=Cacopsylla melanoneura TaxID=428564 RepID=A0A8D8QFZ5_9HEMI
MESMAANMVYLLLTLLLVSRVFTTEDYDDSSDQTLEEEDSNRLDPNYDDWAEQRSRRNNIMIHGYPIKKGNKGDPMAVVGEIGEKLGFEDPLDMVLSAVRIRPSRPEHQRPIIVHLTDMEAKKKWTKAYTRLKLWEKKIYINEHLSKYNQKLFKRTKEWAREHNWKYVWVYNCTVRVRQNELTPEHEVTHVEQLKRLERERFKNRGVDIE